MIKRIRPVPSAPVYSVHWLNLEDGLEVELTSEDPAWPIQGALLPQLMTGWRAATGAQTITLVWC